MRYDEAMEFLNKRGQFGIRLGLERIRKILGSLGNPERNLKVIHVAGTNGKGSVCAMVGSILKAAGYKTGIYTSPHLTDFRERISVNGRWVSKEDVAEALDRIIPIAESIAKETDLGHPTYFEIVTAAALYHFSLKACDYVVIEVGMGGRLDATNVVDPILSAITNVTMEHSEHLGDTVEKIAREKAGIIKEGKPIVTNATGPALDVIKDVSRSKGSEVLHAVDKIKPVRSNLNEKVQLVTYNESEILLPLMGDFQLENANTAIAIIETLKRTGIEIPDPSLKEGLENVRWPGRFQLMDGKPLTILDCAHNPAGMHSFRETLDNMLVGDENTKITLVIGASSDKDITKMLKEIAPIATNIIVTKHTFSSRAESPERIAGLAKQYCSEVHIESDVHQALDLARLLSGKEDLILVTGSIYLIGDVMGNKKSDPKG